MCIVSVGTQVFTNGNQVEKKGGRVTQPCLNVMNTRRSEINSK